MRVLFLDPIGGISGDMTLGALVDAGVSVERIDETVRCFGVEGWRFEVGRRELSGVVATKVDVVVDGTPPRRDWRDIRRMLESAPVDEEVRALALSIFGRLAEAEAKVHGVRVEDVHFHEVGAVDAIVDICGAAAAVTTLGVRQVVAAPPPLGRGLVKSDHGPLPVPGPATLELLRGLPVAASQTEGELTTPTGAAILAALTEGRVGSMPAMRVEEVGYGAGSATWPDRPNLLRAVVGEALEEADSEVVLIEANLDDLTPELLAAAVESLLDAGALDAWVAPVTGKKGRPGHILTALGRPDRKEHLVRTLLRETTSFGVRWRSASRLELEREHVEVETPFGPVRVKVGRLDGEVLTASPEFEDCRRRAGQRAVAVREVYAAAIAAFRARSG